jgi:hypothetical protein
MALLALRRFWFINKNHQSSTAQLFTIHFSLFTYISGAFLFKEPPVNGPSRGAFILGGEPLCRVAASPPRGNYSGRETPLSALLTSPPWGEIISYYLVEIHSVAELFPPSPSRSRYGRARLGGNKRG